MKKRHQRNRVSWQPHLDNASRFILTAAEKCRDRSKVVVLGAGLLLDVPLNDLSRVFREVVLIDIAALPEVLDKVKRFNNVRFIQCDVTNVAAKLYENSIRGSTELPEPEPTVSEIDSTTGLVVSLNILSQLWVIPRTYALRKMRGLEDEAVDDWCEKIVTSHYNWLRSLSCDRCIIADREYVQRDREGKIVSQGSTIYGLNLPEPDDSWTWNIAPRGHDRRHLSKELKVGAWLHPA